MECQLIPIRDYFTAIKKTLGVDTDTVVHCKRNLGPNIIYHWGGGALIFLLAFQFSFGIFRVH